MSTSVLLDLLRGLPATKRDSDMSALVCLLMAQRPWFPVAIAVLLFIAGCAGFTADTRETPASTETTASPPTVSSTPTATPSPASEVAAYPAGWSEQGVKNTTVAFQSHYRAMLTGPSATVTYHSRVIESTEPRKNTTLDMAIDTGEQQLYAAIDGKTTHREFYFADRTLSTWSVQNQSLVGQSRASFIRAAQAFDSRVLKSQLLTYKLEHTTTRAYQGRTALVYNVTGVYSNAVSQSYGAATSATGHIVVTESGRILKIETTVTYTNGTLAYRYAHTDLGETSVTEADWLQAV